MQDGGIQGVKREGRGMVDGGDTVVGEAVQKGTGMVRKVLKVRLEGGDPLGVDEGQPRCGRQGCAGRMGVLT
jgi:hypothetical protein